MIRVLLGSVGVVVGAYGAWLLLSRQDGEQLHSVALWLVGGVLLHDVALSAVVLVLGTLVVRRLPASLRAPVAVAGIVVGSVTLVAVPALGRFGALPDDPTLLDRDYRAGYLGFLAVVLVVTTAAVVVRSRRAGARRPLRHGTVKGPDPSTEETRP